jgi:hypothetical protein
MNSRALVPTVLILAVTLAVALGIGELLLRWVNLRLDGIVDRLGWGWGRQVILVLWGAAATDWLGRRRRLNLRRR